jgi:hypothetical protein
MKISRERWNEIGEEEEATQEWGSFTIYIPMPVFIIEDERFMKILHEKKRRERFQHMPPLKNYLVNSFQRGVREMKQIVQTDHPILNSLPLSLSLSLSLPLSHGEINFFINFFPR